MGTFQLVKEGCTFTVARGDSRGVILLDGNGNHVGVIKIACLSNGGCDVHVNVVYPIEGFKRTDD